MRPIQHNGTATFLAWSAKNLRNSRNRTLGTLWDAPWCCSGLLGVNDSVEDTLSHHPGPSRLADVGAEMLARGLRIRRICRGRGRRPDGTQQLIMDRIQAADSVKRTLPSKVSRQIEEERLRREDAG